MLHIQFPEITFPVHDLDKVTIPRMVRIRQNYSHDRIEDIPGQLDLEFSKHDYAASVRGKRIAVTVGSRGIPDNAAIVRSICQHLKAWGADPNVTGRGFMPYFKDDFHTKKLFIRGLSEQSHSNACGLGLADITTRRCLDSVDWESTWINLTTNLMIDAGKILLYQNNNYDAIRIALKSCPRIDFKRARIARIRDTLSLNEFEVSAALAEELKNAPDVEIISDPYELSFDDGGFLADLQ